MPHVVPGDGQRVVRRPRTAASRAALAPVWALVWALLLGTAGCAGLGQPAPYDSPGINGLEIPTPSPSPEDFVDRVDNPWLALAPGATWSYEVSRDGEVVGSVEAEVLDGTTDVAGLRATAVRAVTDLDGTLADTEVTRLYAQDDDGNVWLVGIDSLTGISWRAGEGGAQAGLAMPADPRPGDGWATYRLGDADGPTTAIAERSREMVQTLNEADTATRRTYESGVGLVAIEDLDVGWQTVLQR